VNVKQGVLNLKVLLVTGLLAEDTVKRYAQSSSVKTEVLALKVPVAALLTPAYIADALKNLNIHAFDMVLVPGLIRGDASAIAEAAGVPTFKGSRYAADLPTVLDAVEQIELSTVTPACDILSEELQRKALQELAVVEKNRDALLKKRCNMLIGELAVGKDFPMRVMAEIVDVPLLSTDEIQRLAKRYVKAGADIIDVGMVAGESKPAEAKRAVEAVKRVVNVPVSIDTFDPREIEEAVSAGAELVLSVDAGNIEDIAPFVFDSAAVVVVPTNQRKGYFPSIIEERASFLEENIKKARELGITQVIGDLVLEPTDISGSFVAFREFAGKNPTVPLLVGVGNVTELMDADSVGVNALLACLSSEVGASLLLTTEKSDKTQGSVREVAVAAKMMFLAKKRNSVPRDLHLDLLLLKDKSMREEPYNKGVEAETQVITASEELKPVLFDAKGLFKVAVDRVNEAIVALHFSAQAEKPTVIIKGKTAGDVNAKIVEMSLITRLEHAAYLGSELEKAEIALRTGKEYIQDNPLFKKEIGA
jgi:dihydropteroate synthase-like protein